MKILRIPTGALQVNTYLVPLGEKGSFGDTSGGGTPVVVVDPGDDGDLIVATLVESHLCPVGIALTHHHFDHVLGLKQLRDAFPKIHIGAHPTAEPNFGADMGSSVTERLRLWGAGGLVPRMRALPLPDVSLSDGATWEALLPEDASEDLRRAARLWVTLHTPGHSAPSVCYYNRQESQLLSGDTMFWGTWGRTDLPDSDEGAMAKSLKRLYTLPDDTLVFPGHERCGFALGENRGLV